MVSVPDSVKSAPKYKQWSRPPDHHPDTGYKSPSMDTPASSPLKDHHPGTGMTASEARLSTSGLNKGGVNSTSARGDASFAGPQDSRARLSLSPKSGGIFYKDPENVILEPLHETSGIVWPYTPDIMTIYTAQYTGQQLPHTNYMQQSYNSSTIGEITVNGMFTANTDYEAKYLLAVIQFMKSCTKSFYGTDQNRGTPPPVLRFSAHGPQMFNSVPVVMTTANFNFEQGVDYINASYIPNNSNLRTYSKVPTQLQITVSLLPVVSREAQTQFSLREYSKGALIGSVNGKGGLL